MNDCAAVLMFCRWNVVSIKVAEQCQAKGTRRGEQRGWSRAGDLKWSWHLPQPIRQAAGTVVQSTALTYRLRLPELTAAVTWRWETSSILIYPTNIALPTSHFQPLPLPLPLPGDLAGATTFPPTTVP